MRRMLYTGAIAPGDLSRRLRAFAKTHLQSPAAPPRTPRTGRRRIGLISPLLSASPVYYLTFSTWAALAGRHDLVMFQRGTRADHATERFRALATEWHDVAHLAAGPLADRLAAAELDVVFDLGGWSDVTGLAALSTRPAARAYTWVGGQSATTGLDAFDGWIGDRWQSPATARPLYAEPLIEIDRGYCDYTAPAGIDRYRDMAKSGVALVGNPVKVVEAMAAGWPAGVDRVTLIDRRYAHARTLDRVRALLARMGVSVAAVVTPEGHEAYLAAVARVAAIVNTAPYAAGLTAVEAYRMGVKVIGPLSGGPLFAQRHLLSHARTRGRNPTLAGQIAGLIAQP
jgi:protein O-GlcNAc transferase